jgi:hypothetical protein
MRYSWFCVALADGASRFDANTKNDPSRAQAGDVSFLSFVKVSWRVDETPRSSETRWMSVWRFASFQSGVDSVYSSHLPSGLGVGEPICFMCCMSRNVIARLPVAGAWAAAGSARRAPRRNDEGSRKRIDMGKACTVSLKNGGHSAKAGGLRKEGKG